MFMELYQQNEKIKEEKAVLQDEISRLRVFLQQVSTPSVPSIDHLNSLKIKNEAYAQNRASLQAVHTSVSGVEHLLQECLAVVTNTKQQVQSQIQ